MMFTVHVQTFVALLVILTATNAFGVVAFAPPPWQRSEQASYRPWDSHPRPVSSSSSSSSLLATPPLWSSGNVTEERTVHDMKLRRQLATTSKSLAKVLVRVCLFFRVEVSACISQNLFIPDRMSTMMMHNFYCHQKSSATGDVPIWRWKIQGKLSKFAKPWAVMRWNWMYFPYVVGHWWFFTGAGPMNIRER
jgi:hypothetical protein